MKTVQREQASRIPKPLVEIKRFLRRRFTATCRHQHATFRNQKKLLNELQSFYLPPGSPERYVLHSSLDCRKFRRYEAKELAKYHIAWLDQTYLQEKNEQDIVGVLCLKEMIKTLAPRLSAEDLRITMSATDMTNLLKQLSEVFFNSVIPLDPTETQAIFEWLPASESHKGGNTSIQNLLPRIRLHPTLRDHPPWWVGEDAMIYKRLSTLIHELSHAFFLMYACQRCPDWPVQEGIGGHGEAWQALAQKLEQVASKLLEYEFDLSRVASLIWDQDNHQRLARGKEDWMAFGFDDAPSAKTILESPEKFHPWLVDGCKKMKNGD
jgi:hypothetical protein